MLLSAVVLTATGILIAFLIAAIIYAVGVYIFHGSPGVVGVIALIVFALLLVGNVSIN